MTVKAARLRDMDGHTIGVFGSEKDVKTSFENAIAKKSEVEGMIVYHRNESGRRFSFLDDPQFPDTIQGYSRIASISDHAYYLLPTGGRLTAPDGELAVLLDAFGLPGTIQIIDGGASADTVKAAFKGLRLAEYPVEQRSRDSSIIDLSRISDPPGTPEGTVVYIDRAFVVKGVGTVVLGFVLSGKVSVHDELRAVPSSPERLVEVKGIQVNDEDHESAGRGVRVGLSLKGVEARELDKVSWLDDGSFGLTDKMELDFRQSAYYKQSIDGKNLHLQLPGELVMAKLAAAPGARLTASLPNQVPVWPGMRVAVIDLNGKGLRVAGGGQART
jgi:selenocysteine-specific translation elongation factor